MTPAKRYDFDVAISYAGQDGTQAQTVSESLTCQYVSSMNDTYKQALLGKENLPIRFADRYPYRACYCVIFCSKQHIAKLWTTYTLHVAQRCTKQENQAPIFPTQLDDTEIPSLLLPAVSLRQPPENAATIITTVMRKLGRTTSMLPSQIDISQDVLATTSQLDAPTIIHSRHGKAGTGWGRSSFKKPL